MRPFAAAVLLSGAMVSAAAAAEDRPVTCQASATYAGPALHAPPGELQAAGEIGARLDGPTVARLEAAADRAFAASRSHSMTSAVAAPGRGSWSTLRGDGPEAHYWASAGKQATAVIVLQLVEEGRLKLTDPISNWVGATPNGGTITIRHLLEHTSGLFSANEDLQARKRGAPASLAEELKIVQRHGAMFCAGERWRYSNSGYRLLGEVIERLEGRSYADSVRIRIADRLGLTSFEALTPGAHSKIAPLRPDDPAQAPIDPGAPGPAGSIAATAADMVRFEQALLGGRLLKPETVRAMSQRLYPMFDAGTFYGLGLMLYDPPGAQGEVLWVGHSGGTPGAKAVSVFATKQRAFVAVALSGDGSAEASANLLLQALEAHP